MNREVVETIAASVFRIWRLVGILFAQIETQACYVGGLCAAGIEAKVMRNWSCIASS
jgi:hypothetical protein